MQAGERIADRYRLERRLGVGAYGEVWAVADERAGTSRALKILHDARAASDESRRRFVREAKACALIRHPSIVRVDDVGEHEGTPFLVMEILEGCALDEAFEGALPLSLWDFVHVASGLAGGLAAAHAAGVVHRDIKPQNIFLVTAGRGPPACRILDFGIAKLFDLEDTFATRTGTIVGSPRYMSPEQMRADPVDARSDLWSLGVVLFLGMTGEWPHDADSVPELVLTVTSTPPKSIDALVPSAPKALREVVRECLLPVDERIRSAAEIVRRLSPLLSMRELAAIGLPMRIADVPTEGQTERMEGWSGGASADDMATDRMSPDELPAPPGTETVTQPLPPRAMWSEPSTERMSALPAQVESAPVEASAGTVDDGPPAPDSPSAPVAWIPAFSPRELGIVALVFLTVLALVYVALGD